MSLQRVKHKNRGSILILTVLFLVVISMFALAFWNIVPVELHSARRQMLETQAYFASDAGVVDSLAFLEKITGDGNIDNYFNNHGVVNDDGHRVLKRSGETGSWSWEVEIIPGPETFGHKDNQVPNPLRVYQIVATAYRDGTGPKSHRYRKVSCWVRQKSFTDNNWGNMATAGDPLWLFMDSFTLGGDYHTNGKGLLQIEDSKFWKNKEPAIKGNFAFVKPSFYGKSATNNDKSGELLDGVTYSNWGEDFVPYSLKKGSRGEPIPNRYEKISGNGRAGVKMTQEIELPESSDSIAFGVWGDTPPSGSLTDGQKVFGDKSEIPIALSGSTPGSKLQNGLYIEGDVAQIDFSTNAGSNVAAAADDPADDNQIIRIYQGNNKDRYVEVIHVMGRSYKIPAGATVTGASAGATLQPSANGGKGYTVVRQVSTDSSKNNRYAVYNEQGNGAIFVTGDVGGVRGLVKGRRTIGVSTDVGNKTAKDKTILINGDLLYAGTNPKNADPALRAPQSPDSMLGLIGYAVRVQSTEAPAAPTLANPQIGLMWPNRKNTTVSNPLYLYCSIFAGRRNDPAMTKPNPTHVGEGFGSVNADSASGNKFKQGHMLLYGSITEGLRQIKAQGYSSGNSYQFDLDPNLEQIQPPFFPTLPFYDLLTWEEKSVFSY